MSDRAGPKHSKSKKVAHLSIPIAYTVRAVVIENQKWWTHTHRRLPRDDIDVVEVNRWLPGVQAER